MCNTVWPYRLEPSRFHCLWDSPGKNTGMGCHSFLQGIFPTQGSNWVSCIAGRFFTSWATREAGGIGMIPNPSRLRAAEASLFQSFCQWTHVSTYVPICPQHTHPRNPCQSLRSCCPQAGTLPSWLSEFSSILSFPDWGLTAARRIRCVFSMP